MIRTEWCEGEWPDVDFAGTRPAQLPDNSWVQSESRHSGSSTCFVPAGSGMRVKLDWLFRGRVLDCGAMAEVTSPGLFQATRRLGLSDGPVRHILYVQRR